MNGALSTREIIPVTETPLKVFPVAAAIMFSLLIIFTLLAANPVMAQDDPASAAEDTIPAGEEPNQDDEYTQEGSQPGLNSGMFNPNSNQNVSVNDLNSGFITEFTNEPMVGVKANDRMNTIYAQWDNFLKMTMASSFSNVGKWSQDDYRKQDKVVEKRGLTTTYAAGKLLPFNFNVNGNWNWSEDITINTSGITNISKRDVRVGTVNLNKNRIQTGPLTTSLRGGFGVNIQDAVTQHKKNDFNEANFNGGIQSGIELVSGIRAVGRVYGKNLSGDRSLGDSTSPSSATTDSLGFGVYFKRGIAKGRVAITRGNFDRNYLAFRTNAYGLIDTTDVPEDEKIIEELETKDAVSLDVENLISVGRFKFETKYSHTTSNQNFAQAATGLKERSADIFMVKTNFGVGRDSFVVAYDFSWKWDDHRPNGQGYRGRQYVKDRKVAMLWQRVVFDDTKLVAKYETTLSQDIAEREYNSNDKDRISQVFNLKANRNWGTLFRASLMFSYKTNQDLSIRASKSANNNQKDSYEVAPGFTWKISEWVTFTQNYRLYIQYTDYLFSDLDYINKNGNYNKRGNLSTRITFKPTGRLTVTVKHDLNKRFNATETSENAAGNTFYHKDQIQEVSKVDLAMVFNVIDGVVLEGATFRTRDDKEVFGARANETLTLGGEIWVGTRVSKTWGGNDDVELSMRVKKVNAYGPSVSKESSDYWDADIWLKWSF